MATARNPSKVEPEPTWVTSSYRVHREVRRQLKAHAALAGLSMEDYLHEILCRELDRLDLIQMAPSAR